MTLYQKPLLALILMSITLTTYGLTPTFLKNPASQQFTVKDWQLFYYNQKFALNHKQDGNILHWRNPHTNHGGYFIPSDTKIAKGVTCRKLTIITTVKDKESKGTFRYCKINRIWTVVRK